MTDVDVEAAVADDLVQWCEEELERAEETLIVAALRATDVRGLLTEVHRAAAALPSGSVMTPAVFIEQAPNDVIRATRRGLIRRAIGEETNDESS
jgi:hypothetical protein